MIALLSPPWNPGLRSGGVKPGVVGSTPAGAWHFPKGLVELTLRGPFLM